jgi:phosphoglycolate phosphatase
MVRIVFDFDGTMVNSKPLAIEIYNELAKARGYKRIEQHHVPHLSSLSIPNRIKELNIPAVRLPKLVLDIKRRYKDKVHTLSAVKGISDLFASLSANGLKPDIISSNTVENIKTFSERNHFSDTIGSVFSGNNIFGKHRVINNYLKLHHISKEQMIYVGDELRDIEACKRVGIKMIAVAWGYDSIELLQSSNPDFIINEPHEIMELFPQVLPI